jgi:L-ascorbate metabolism protein UlaG (beta-lactamase superfamily)
MPLVKCTFSEGLHLKNMPALERAKKKGRKFQNPVETKQAMFGLLFKILKLYKTNKEERIPRRALGPFRTDASIYTRPPASGLRITWMGHSTMLIEIDGLRVLVDPIWDKRASPVSWAGPKRFFESPLQLNELPPLDVILISHDHYDHLGAQTIRKLSRLPAASNAKWITSLGVGKRLRCFGVKQEKIAELDWTESLTVARTRSDTESNPSPELKITALPARHFSGRGMFDRFDTLWSSFVLQGARHKIYFGADSGLWEGFAEIGRQYGPFDLTMLEVGAYNPLWKSIHMGPDGAGQAFAMMGASGLLMPIHWGLFSLALHAWRQPIERITDLAAQSNFKLWSPAPGAPTEVIAGQSHRSNWWRPT